MNRENMGGFMDEVLTQCFELAGLTRGDAQGKVETMSETNKARLAEGIASTVKNYHWESFSR